MPLNRANNVIFGTATNYALPNQSLLDPLQRWYGLSSNSLTINPYGYITGTGNYGTSNTISPHFDVNGNFTVNFAYVVTELQTNTLKIGTSNNTENYISFRGTTGDEPGNFTHTFIGERLYGGTENSELLLFKGNDIEGISGPDRIRLFANNHVFDTYTVNAVSGTFASVGATGQAVTRMIIKENGNIGIGTITPNTIATSSTPAMLGIVSNAVGTTGLVVKAIASQTARLQQWQNSAGTVLAEISGGGDLFMSSATRAFFGGSSETAYLNVSTLGNPARQGIIIQGGSPQTANLQEWKNSSGTTLLSVSPDGYLNKTGTLLIGPVLQFADPGVGNETKFIFTKATDGAYLTVKERSSDQTFYEFGMTDNPLDGGDYFQWAAGQWSGPGYGWMPLQIGNNSGKPQTLRFIGEQSIFWSPISTPVNSPYFTYLGANIGSTEYDVLKFTPSNSSSVNVNRLESSGSTATFNIDISEYTYAARMGYRVTIDAGATTFSYTTYGGDSSSGSAIAINAGNWVTLSNGLKIKIGAGALAGENWSFLAFPTPRVGIGGQTDTSTLGIIRPAATDKGLIIKGAISQTANLQEWQDSNGTVLGFFASNGTLKSNYVQTTLLRSPLSDKSQIYTDADGNGAIRLDVGGPTQKGFIIRGAASQTADLQQWQDSAGTTVASITSGGYFYGSSIELDNFGKLTTIGLYTNEVPLTVVAAASQTADLQQWQNNSFTTVAKIDVNGNFKGGVVYDINDQAGTSYTFVLSDSKAVVMLNNANNITASIPTNSTPFPIGSSITIVQLGLGQVTIQALTPGTTTILSNAVTPAAPRLRGILSSATLIKVSAENWLAIGDIY